MVQGKQLAEQIPALLDQQTDEARDRAAREFAEYFRRFVIDIVTPEEALESFAVYRRFDLAQTRGGQSSTIESMKEASPKLCDDLAVHFQTIPKAVIASFVAESWEEYASKRSLLFAARSRGTHVSGVLRPLSKRYMKQWEHELVKRSDFSEIQARAESLLEEEVVTTQALEKWADDVFALFSTIGVYRAPNGGQEKSTSSGKPSGMISEGSLRTYKQQWFSWTTEHASNLLGGENAKPQTHNAGVNASLTHTPTEPSSLSRSPGVRLVIYSANDPTFRIEKSWPSVALLLNEIDVWGETAKKVWPDAEAFVVDLDYLEDRTDLQVSLQEETFAGLVRRVKSVLSAAN